MNANDDELDPSGGDARFVRAVDAAYRPPEPSAADRARFAAGLEARITRSRARRPWLVGGAAAAAAAAALVLALLPGGEPATQLAREATPAPADDSPSTEEALLLLTNGPLADPDEALPDDYRTIASLLE
jgi:hypothetical protein